MLFRSNPPLLLKKSDGEEKRILEADNSFLKSLDVFQLACAKNGSQEKTQIKRQGILIDAIMKGAVS